METYGLDFGNMGPCGSLEREQVGEQKGEITVEGNDIVNDYSIENEPPIIRHVSSDYFSSSEDELCSIPMRRCVRTLSGRFANLLTQAEDEKESVGLLEFEGGIREVRRKSSFDKNTSTPSPPSIHVPSSPQSVSRDAESQNHLSRPNVVVRTKSGRTAHLLITAEDDSEVVSVVEYTDGHRALRRALSLNQLAEEENSNWKPGSTYYKVAFGVHSDDDDSDFEDVIECRNDIDVPRSNAEGEDIIPRQDSCSLLTPESKPSESPSSSYFEQKPIVIEETKAEVHTRRLSLSSDRLGWIDQDECEELFGLSMERIKQKSPAWWKKHSKKLAQPG